MAIRQDQAQGARAAGTEGDITDGGSVFGPDGVGQFVCLGEVRENAQHIRFTPKNLEYISQMPGATQKASQNRETVQVITENAGKLPSMPETSLKRGQILRLPRYHAKTQTIASSSPRLAKKSTQIPQMPEHRPKNRLPYPNAQLAADFTVRDSGGGNGPKWALPSGKPAGFLEAKTIDRLRRWLFDKRRTQEREARYRSTWTKSIAETITAIQTSQAGPSQARPDGKKRIAPREFSWSWMGPNVAYYVFEQPEGPNQAIADILEMKAWRSADAGGRSSKESLGPH